MLDGQERPVAVAVTGGNIVAIGPLDADWSAAEELRLASDEVLLPGLVDSHVHVNEPGRTEWEGFETATRAALRGGITTIIDRPLNSLPPTIDVDADALTVKRKAADGQCFVDVCFWGGAVLGNLADLADPHAGGVFGFKCFLIDSGVPAFPPLPAEQLPKFARVLADLEALLIVHAEDAEAMAEAPEPNGRSYQGFLDSRPPAGENTAIANVIAAARETGCRSHILHLSSAESMPMLAEAKAEGLPLSVETCPHYLCFSAEVGRQADFAVFAPAEVFIVDPPRLEHRNPVSPCADRELSGVVRSTWLRGRRITTARADAQLLSAHPGAPRRPQPMRESS